MCTLTLFYISKYTHTRLITNTMIETNKQEYKHNTNDNKGNIHNTLTHIGADEQQ